MKSSFSTFLLFLFLLALPPVASATTWYVNGTTGNDNNNCLLASTACKTIGHAISLAAAGDTIQVAAATYRENLTIKTTLSIIGSGAHGTIIDGEGINSVVTISSAIAKVVISNMTVRNGATHQHAGGGIDNMGITTINNSAIMGNTTCSGGGIWNGGTMTIKNSTISGNNVSQLGICRGFGGGIANSGTLTLNDSTISGNTASGIFGPTGGGIYNNGTMTVNNSTISGNVLANSGTSAGTDGGGIANVGTLKVNSSTISANGAQFGGNLHGNMTIQNSIVANSLFGGNCNGTVTSQGYNLSSDNTCNLKSVGDRNGTNPMLGPLRNNGGPTQTMALLAGSPAIDAGNPAGCKDSSGVLLKTDQRGDPRPDDEDTGGCDIGAFENNGTLTGSCLVPVGHECVSGAAALGACPAGTPVVSPGDVVCGLIQNLVPVDRSKRCQTSSVTTSGYCARVSP